jgi:hypothetical protein
MGKDRHHRNGTVVDIGAVSAEPTNTENTPSPDSLILGVSKPVDSTLSTHSFILTAQTVADTYRLAIANGDKVVKNAQAYKLGLAIKAGDAFNLYAISNSLTLRGASEEVAAIEQTLSANTIRSYGRLSQLASKVGTSKLLEVGTIVDAQRLLFLDNKVISTDAAKTAVDSFVSGVKIDAIRESLHLQALENKEGIDFLTSWVDTHLGSQETEETKVKASEVKACKKILRAIVKSNVQEYILAALLAGKAHEADEDIEEPETLTPFEQEIEIQEAIERATAREEKFAASNAS